MLQIENILFPTDQSECAEQARAHAAFLADWHDARLHVVGVIPKEGYPPDLLDELRLSDEEVADQLHLQWGQDDVAGAAAEEVPKSKLIVKQLEAGSAAEGILDYTEEQSIDLVVMGTHGRRGAGRLLLGSVAEEVVRRSECPVLTVRPDGEKLAQPTVRRILAPVDFFEFTHLAIDYAVELAQTYGARIDLLHVLQHTALPEPYGMPPMMDDLEQMQKNAHRGLEKLVREDIGYEDVRVAVEIGHPATGIADYAEAHDIDLVVIPTHGRSGLKRILLGSVAEKVVRRAPCPVFTVKSFGKSLLPASSRRVAEA